MSIEKGDEQFKKDVQKLSIRGLAKKYKISVRQVSRRKKRLKEEVFLREATPTYAQPPTPTSANRKMTFWLTPGMIMWLKKKAKIERRTCSSILREILQDHLKPGEKRSQRGPKSGT